MNIQYVKSWKPKELVLVFADGTSLRDVWTSDQERAKEGKRDHFSAFKDILAQTGITLRTAYYQGKLVLMCSE